MSQKPRIKRIQRHVSEVLGRDIAADGIPGPQTWGAIEEAFGIGRGSVPQVPAGGALDARSEKNIATLLPEVQPVFRWLVHKANEVAAGEGMVAKAISGNRTYAEQNALYAQGRTKPGKRVTNARGGQSWHNFGLAVDLGLFDVGDGHYVDGRDSSRAYRIYKKLAAEAEEKDIEWGGMWRFTDPPHFQYDTGLTMAQLRARKAAGKALV